MVASPVNVNRRLWPPPVEIPLPWQQVTAPANMAGGGGSVARRPRYDPGRICITCDRKCKAKNKRGQ